MLTLLVTVLDKRKYSNMKGKNDCCIFHFLIAVFINTFRYIKHPNDESLSTEFLHSGKYEVEISGKKYPADMYLKSPFDPQNKRLLNIYHKL